MISLHAHSYHSKLTGTLAPSQIISFAKEKESRFAALADINSMSGLIHFAQQAEQEKIKPVLGAVIDDPEDKNISVLLLAKNNKGYADLCKIITMRKLQDDFKLKDIFNGNLNSLFVLVSSPELLKNISVSEELKKNLFVELAVTERLKKNTRRLYEYALSKGLQIAATHPAYFEKPEDFLLHKVVSAIRENTTLENLSEDEIADEEFYLKSPQELREVWRKLPEAFENAEFIAKNCNVDLEFGKYKHPVFPLPEGETPYSLLWKICFKGLEKRYQPITEKAVKRLQYELEVIDELGYCDYFLIVRDIIREAKNRRMMTIGRGSAANSLVAYCLEFTQVDPIKHNLYFERFLNRGRTSPPDVDLDFSWRERDEIVKYVFEKYGYDKVAMISTAVTFRARSAFRETAKVFGVAESEISKYSKLIPWTSASNLPLLAEKFPESKSLKFTEEPWKSIINIASKLSGFPRHSSIHPSGIIITPEPITNYIALEYAKNKGLGLIITQPDMYPIEDMGLIKIDLLSQRSLGVLRDTMNVLYPEEKAPVNKARIFNIFGKKIES